MSKRRKTGRTAGGWKEEQILIFFLGRKPLLSSFPANPTVGILRGKEEGCSTHRGLRVDSGFREFRQTQRGRGFILLGFYHLFKFFIMFRLF